MSITCGVVSLLSPLPNTFSDYDRRGPFAFASLGHRSSLVLCMGQRPETDGGRQGDHESVRLGGTGRRFVLLAGLFTDSPNSSNLDMSDDDEDAHSTLLSFVPLTPPRLIHKHCLACPSPTYSRQPPVPPKRWFVHHGRTTSMSRRPPPPLQPFGLRCQSGILTWTPNTIPTADPFPNPALAPANAPVLTPRAACNELEESGPRY
jgi:hypothetical protein